MKDWSIPYFLRRMLSESGADGILVSVNEGCRAIRFEFIKKGATTHEFNIPQDEVRPGGWSYAQPLDYVERESRYAMMSFASHAKKLWLKEQGPYGGRQRAYDDWAREKYGKADSPFFNSTYSNNTAGQQSFTADELRKQIADLLDSIRSAEEMVRPKGKTTVESCVDVNTGRECKVTNVPRIEDKKS